MENPSATENRRACGHRGHRGHREWVLGALARGVPATQGACAGVSVVSCQLLGQSSFCQLFAAAAYNLSMSRTGESRDKPRWSTRVSRLLQRAEETFGIRTAFHEVHASAAKRIVYGARTDRPPCSGHNQRPWPAYAKASGWHQPAGGLNPPESCLESRGSGRGVLPRLKRLAPHGSA